MAQIINTAGEVLYLNRYHIFGRDPQISSTLLKGETYSKLHATIFYENNKWFIEDRSANGIVINNSLIHIKKIALETVKTIRFSISAQEEWTIKDLLPPASYLFNTSDNTVLLVDEKLEVIYDYRSFVLSKNGVWQLENQDSLIPLNGEEIIFYNGIKHIFTMNESIADVVIERNHQPDFEINFELSDNFEDVNVLIDLCGSKTEILGKPFNFLWYLLAKKVKHDMQFKLPEEKVGWIDTQTLLTLLNKECKQDVDMYYLNLQIHRLRKQLMRVDSNYNYFFNNLIQRRKGQIRMNSVAIKINEPTYELYAEMLS